MKKTVAILDTDLSNKEFYIQYHQKIDELIKDPKVYIIISDTNLMAMKYINKIGFRNCTIYHTGKTPKQNVGNFKTKSEFTSFIELEEALKQDSSEIL